MQVESRYLYKLFEDFEGGGCYFVVGVWEEFDKWGENILHEDVAVNNLFIYLELGEELFNGRESDFPFFIVLEVLEKLFS